MKTLYDLLGALPSDDAEGLRTAFRKAVKGVHPDIHPDDPYAALKFREIVRANEILVDDDQRAAYDHLLELARQEQELVSRHAVAARIHRIATGVIAIAVVSLLSVGGYLLFANMSATALADLIEIAINAPAELAAASPATAADASDENPSPVRIVTSETASEAFTPDAATIESGADPRTLRARGVHAYHNGDLTGALAALDHAIHLDPEFSAAYIDRGIVFYRLQEFDRAYADISRAKRLEKQGRAKSASSPAAKPRPNRTGAAAPSAPPMPRPRAAQAQQPPEWIESAVH